MTAAAARVRSYREAVLCAVLAAAASSVLVFVVPRGGDLAAHLYRTALVRHDILVWDNLWYAGEYPLASYSLLYYVLAAAVGNATLGVAAVVAAAVIFAAVARGEWGRFGTWPARLFAVLVAGQAFTAAYPFDCGLATLVATLWALQRRRFPLAAVCTVLTVLLSPLAFVLLVLALAALLLRRRGLDRQTAVVAAGALAAGGAQLATLLLFRSPALVYPYGVDRFAGGLVVAALGGALAWRSRAGAFAVGLFAAWGAATVLAFAIPSPVGHNLTRASIFVVPLTVALALRSGFRPRPLALAAVSAALVANVAPYLAMIPVRSAVGDARVSFWAPAIAFLRAHDRPGFRVEVVPTANHWEAYYLPLAGYALARGWYRQLDIADNPVLYARRLGAAAYDAWLHEAAVRFVLLPRTRLDVVDGPREAALLRTKQLHARRVWSGSSGVIYAVPHPTSILSGPGAPRITRFDSRGVAGTVSRPGTYLLRVHYMPYWTLSGSVSCLRRTRSDMTALVVRNPGAFALRAQEGALTALASALDGGAACG